MQEDNNTYCTIVGSPPLLTLELRSEWIVDHVCEIEAILDRLRARCGGSSGALAPGEAVSGASSRRMPSTGSPPAPVTGVRIDDRHLEEFDLSGAWLLYRFCETLKQSGCQVDLDRLQSRHLTFIEQIVNASPERDPPPRASANLVARIAALGEAWLQGMKSTASFIAFLGQVFMVLGGGLLRPHKLRWPSIVRHIEETGFNAIPIVCLLAFLISIVLAYQGTTQLSRFGAEIYTIDLVAISVLREMGVLLTAIMVAGRSGSAFAAEIGVMKLNQEVAAMQTLGIDPMHALMVPRTLALMLTLPMLTLFADLVGFVGGAVVAVISLDIPFSMFMERLHATVTMTHFLVGLTKAPVFAFVIAIIGIRQGFQVEHSAEDVGRNTTRAVVQSIFAVIAIDALFSIMTTELGY